MFSLAGDIVSVFSFEVLTSAAVICMFGCGRMDNAEGIPA